VITVLPVRAFDGDVAVGARAWGGEHGEERGGAARPQRERGDAGAPGRAQHSVPLPVDHRAGDRPAAAAHQLLERRLERRLAGGVEAHHPLGLVGAGGDLVGEGLADGDEGELRMPRGVGRVEVGVEHGDAEAPRAEEPRELQHRGDVAPGREGEQHDAAADGRAPVAGHRWCWWW
jgi:hypothetical protein